MDERARALEDLYRERYRTFRDVLSGVTGNYETAREVVQEAFARALRDRRKYRGEGSLEAWVWKIAFRLAIKARRSELQERPVEIPSSDNGPGPGADIRAAVRALPPKRRLIVFLRYFADLSYAEIAEAAGVSAGTVAATLAQAHAELADVLEEKVTR